jgi:hypothetical protein
MHPINKAPNGLSSLDDDVKGPIMMGVGVRHPITKPPNGFSSYLGKSKQKHPVYNLVGLTGWLRRVENEGEKESNKRDKEEVKHIL